MDFTIEELGDGQGWLAKVNYDYCGYLLSDRAICKTKADILDFLDSYLPERKKAAQ